MLDAFISYSTKNKSFVKSLADSLESEDKKVWFDQKRDPLEGIPSGTKWWDEIKYGISQSSNFLFIISPESVVSPYCNAEIAHALQEEKRIVTILYCAEQSVQETLNAINTAIDAIDPALQIPSEVEADLQSLRSLARRNSLAINQVQFVTAFAHTSIDLLTSQVSGAIALDIQWVRLWNDFRQAVQLWAENDKDEGYLWSEVRLRKFRELAEDRKQELDELQQEFALPEEERLLHRLQNINLSHIQRETIGQRLNELGDTRQGISVIDGIPDIVWCAVPGGQITIENENFAVPPFYIAQYLVTYQQFQAFLNAYDGFENAQWWVDIPKKYIMQSMGDQNQQYANYPRENMTWYQAVAFTRWLNHHLQDQTFTPTNQSDQTFTVNANLEIRLPTEWEWQHAATGGNPDKKYPWGDWQEGYANTSESKLGRTTAVGLYLAGQARCGALDMAGNVYEWCLNDHSDLTINIDNEENKILRGGALNYDYFYTTCAKRFKGNPYVRSRSYGIRVVCSPLSYTNRKNHLRTFLKNIHR